MLPRLIVVLLAVFAGLATPASAQEPTSPPTSEPPAERTREVRAIYLDYRRDGIIDACRHERPDLRETLRNLAPHEELKMPDLRPWLDAAIADHRAGDCEEEEEEEEEEEQPTDDEQDDSDTGTPGTGGTGGGTTTPPPVTPGAPDASVTAPDTGGAQPPVSGDDLTPVTPEITPVPPAQAPESTTIPPTEAAIPPPAEPAAPVYANEDDGIPLALVLLAALLGLLALLVLLFALASRAGWGDQVLAGPQRAWREAAFRAGGTWGDFADWIRVGR